MGRLCDTCQFVGGYEGNVFAASSTYDDDLPVLRHLVE